MTYAASRKLFVSPSIFEPDTKRNPGIINDLLKERGSWLHKAGSVRYKAKGMTEKKRQDRIDYCIEQAGKAFKRLIEEIVKQFPDKRPEQSQGFTYNGVEYVLQSFNGETSKYVEKSKFDPNKFFYNKEDYTSYIIRHFARSAVIGSNKDN